MGGNISSSYQDVEISPNKEWLILTSCGAYINIKCGVVFWVVNKTDDKYRITFKLVDNNNDTRGDG